MTGQNPAVRILGVDERVLEQERELPQPGARELAPGELGLLQSFLNTHFDLVHEWGADLLGTPERMLAWFASRGLCPATTNRPSPRQLQRVLAVREGLRELARCNQDSGFSPDQHVLARMNAVADRCSIKINLVPSRLLLSAGGRGELDAALGLLLAIAARSMIEGRWPRLKACPGDHCGWVFYDRSRNNSSHWCSMAVCGGRTKARSHYRRRRRTAVVSSPSVSRGRGPEA